DGTNELPNQLLKEVAPVSAVVGGRVEQATVAIDQDQLLDVQESERPNDLEHPDHDMAANWRPHLGDRDLRIDRAVEYGNPLGIHPAGPTDAGRWRPKFTLWGLQRLFHRLE